MVRITGLYKDELTIMSEQPEAYQTPQPTALENYVQQRLTDLSVMKQANAAIHDTLLVETATLLHGTPQLVQNALHQICIEHGSKPVDTLLLIHDFLATFQAYQQHEVKGEQSESVEPESPFLGRQA